jgi:hypothetical protein
MNTRIPKAKYDHLINLSGQRYTIMNVIVKFLCDNTMMLGFLGED